MRVFGYVTILALHPLLRFGEDDNDRVNIMAFVGMTLSDFMQNELVHKESCAVGLV